MLEIRKLDKETWKDRELTFSYTTDGYYSFDVRGWDFRLVFCPYGDERRKTFSGRLFEEWTEDPAAFGAFDGEELAGVIECTSETWNNRLRITNLLVFEKFRGRGVGTLLMRRALEEGAARGTRMAVLETQTCNRRAVDFYTKTGFRPIGFDLFCYSDSDAEKTEVRLEMAKKLRR